MFNVADRFKLRSLIAAKGFDEAMATPGTNRLGDDAFRRLLADYRTARRELAEKLMDEDVIVDREMATGS